MYFEDAVVDICHTYELETCTISFKKSTLISELKMTLYKSESLGFLLVLIEMRHYFLKTI